MTVKQFKQKFAELHQMCRDAYDDSGSVYLQGSTVSAEGALVALKELAPMVKQLKP